LGAAISPTPITKLNKLGVGFGLSVAAGWTNSISVAIPIGQYIKQFSSEIKNSELILDFPSDYKRYRNFGEE